MRRHDNPIKNETKRGYKEASKQFELLRTKWPLAFPRAPDKVRPLASGGASILAEAFGWSHAYARAVLMVWKLRDTYCRAVLAYSQRINLDGTPSGEHVDDEARQKAKEQLDRIAARKVKKATKMQDKPRVGLAADLSGERVRPCVTRECRLRTRREHDATFGIHHRREVLVQ